VLFSSDAVAKLMNDQFEPVWVSVRDVPMVTIDFGGGKTITRTLNGNVATYALHPDGTVLDILPGIYQPEEYAKQLQQMHWLYKYVSFPNRANPKETLSDRLAAYHKQQAELLADGKEPGQFEFNMLAAVSKARIENPVKFVISGKPPGKAVPAEKTPDPAAIAALQYREAKAADEAKAAKTLRGWKEMAEDTKLNETVHRKAIHTHLAKAGAVQPKDVTKWLYKEVLHADLDDPYLGLGEVLNKNYPFAAEDAKE
jgi:hypothetical protein